MKVAPCNGKTTWFVSFPSRNFTAIKLSDISLAKATTLIKSNWHPTHEGNGSEVGAWEALI